MEQFIIGKKEMILWGEESTYGTAVTPTEYIGINTTVEPDINQSFQEILSAGRGERTVEGRELGPKSLSFTLSFTPTDWRFLKYVFSIDSESGSDPYTHELSIGDTVKSFTLERYFKHATNGYGYRLLGCVINNIRIGFNKPTGTAGEGFIVVNANCFAKDIEKITSETTASEITAEPFQFRHHLLTLDNSEVVEVNSGNFSISQGIDPNDSRYANVNLGRTISDPIPKVARINGTDNVNVKDSTYLDLFLTEGVISNTKKEFIKNSNDKITFQFPNFRIDKSDGPTQLEDKRMVDIEWTDQSPSVTVVDSIQNY